MPQLTFLPLTPTVHQHLCKHNSNIITLTSQSTVLSEKLILTTAPKKCPAFYEIRRFIIVLTTACHWALSWIRQIQSISSHPTSIFISSSRLHLHLSNCLLLSVFLTRILYLFHILPMHTTCHTIHYSSVIWSDKPIIHQNSKVSSLIKCISHSKDLRWNPKAAIMDL